MSICEVDYMSACAINVFKYHSHALAYIAKCASHKTLTTRRSKKKIMSQHNQNECDGSNV